MSSRYAKYIKPRYDADPAFKASVLQRNKQYAERQKTCNPEGYRKARNDASKKCYHAHPEYKEKIRQLRSAQKSTCKTI